MLNSPPLGLMIRPFVRVACQCAKVGVRNHYPTSSGLVAVGPLEYIKWCHSSHRHSLSMWAVTSLYRVLDGFCDDDVRWLGMGQQRGAGKGHLYGNSFFWKSLIIVFTNINLNINYYYSMFQIFKRKNLCYILYNYLCYFDIPNNYLNLQIKIIKKNQIL